MLIVHQSYVTMMSTNWDTYLKKWTVCSTLLVPHTLSSERPISSGMLYWEHYLVVSSLGIHFPFTRLFFFFFQVTAMGEAHSCFPHVQK